MSEFKNEVEYFNAVDDKAKPYVKPIVHYKAYPGENITVGDYANILPVDHPAAYLNGALAHTSVVVSVGPDGTFETLNTRYVLVN